MDQASHLDALLAPLRADVVSGAAVVARMGAEVMRRAVRRVTADTVPDLRSAMANAGIRVIEAQPAMAPLVALVRDVVEASSSAASVEACREAVRDACDAFRAGLETRAQVVAARAAALLPREGDVLTLSSSSTVRAALMRGARERRGRVVVLESRPMQEGRTLATTLAREGISVLFAVDAAGAELASSCAMVLLGADSIGDHGVVNKIGSLAVARAATLAGVPVVVATDATKILPPGFPQPLSDERPAEEVWRPPANVRIWNRYFEAVPLEAVTTIVTESATVGPSEMEALRSDIPLPDELREWALAWAEDGPESGRSM
jgi:translation initiation factor 2B subunit (eIF-2B alpha/beta/delta family)